MWLSNNHHTDQDEEDVILFVSFLELQKDSQ